MQRLRNQQERQALVQAGRDAWTRHLQGLIDERLASIADGSRPSAGGSAEFFKYEAALAGQALQRKREWAEQQRIQEEIAMTQQRLDEELRRTVSQDTPGPSYQDWVQAGALSEQPIPDTLGQKLTTVSLKTLRDRELAIQARRDERVCTFFYKSTRNYTEGCNKLSGIC